MIFLFFWAILTIAFNLFYKNRKIKELKKKWSLLYILFPEWRVFSPKPFNSDLKLYYRDMLVDGSTTKLQEISFYSSKNFSFLNVYNKDRKFFYNLYRVLSNQPNKAYILNEPLYQTLKNYISKIGSTEQVRSRQICIVRTFGYYSDLEKKVELIDYINYG